MEFNNEYENEETFGMKDGRDPFEGAAGVEGMPGEEPGVPEDRKAEAFGPDGMEDAGREGPETEKFAPGPRFGMPRGPRGGGDMRGRDEGSGMHRGGAFGYGMRGRGPAGDHGMPRPPRDCGMRGPDGGHGMPCPPRERPDMPGRMPPPRFNHRPAMRPGFEPEEERREHYASLGLREKVTFQLKALGHILRMMPETRDGQNRVLSILLEKGTLSQRELMELADIRSASLSELIAKLEMNGYVRRVPNPRDRRSMSVFLTEAGALAARALRDSRTDLYEGMTDGELENLLRVLEGLGDRWHAMLPGAAARRVPIDDTHKT